MKNHGTTTYPDPWVDPKSRSTLRFCNLHHRSIRVQNWGLYFLDPPRGLGSNKTADNWRLRSGHDSYTPTGPSRSLEPKRKGQDARLSP